MAHLALNEHVAESILVRPTTESQQSFPIWGTRPALVMSWAILLVVCAAVLAYIDSWVWVVLFLLIIAIGFAVPYALAMLILHPRRTQPQSTPARFGIEHWEEVGFCSPDGIQLRGWFIPPDPQGDGAALVFVHGLGGNRGQKLPDAAALVAKGYGALLFDLRNHGTSGNAVTTLGYLEADDVQSAVEYLQRRPEVNSERIGLIGYSMGGAAALRAAARLPRIKAVVAESTFTSLEDNIAKGMIPQTGLPSFPFVPFMLWLGERLTGLQIQHVRPIDDVIRVSPRPILFVHGTQDRTVQMSNSVKLYEAAQSPKGLYLVPHVSHAEVSSAEPHEFACRISGFLDWAVRGIERRQRPRVSKL